MSSLNAAVLGFALVAASGCNVFDPALYMVPVTTPDAAVPDASMPDAPATDTPAPDAAEPDTAAPDTAEPDVAAPDSAGPEVGPVAALADLCENSLPLMSSSSTPFAVDTTSLKGDYKELVACVGHELLGNDGFVSVEMAAGDKWHVHVNPGTAEFDPAVYILNSCDERACSKVSAIDECGPGKSEHLSFVAPQNGRYRIGIDSAKAGGGAATVVIVKPVCGNGMTEHSETCDDGKTEPGDGCDGWCRKELNAPSVSEAEPNDDPRAANVLSMWQRAGGMTVVGQLGTRCDHDLYSVTLATASTVRVTVSSTMACSADGGSVDLSLIGSDGQTQLKAGTMVGTACPTLEITNLAAGEYYVQMKRTGIDTAWPYQILVEAAP